MRTTVLLGACLIVRDEARFLPGCLESLAGLVDEVVVADTGSTDATRELAEAAGATVIDVPWEQDFAAARNAALTVVTTPWVLAIDADERLVVPDPAALRRLLTQTTSDAASITLADLLPDGDRTRREEAPITRLFRRGVVHWEGRVHERLVRIDGGAPDTVDARHLAVIEHLGYHPQVVAERRKHERNLALALAVDPATASLHDRLHLGRALLAAGRPAEAVPVLTPLLDPTDPAVAENAAWWCAEAAWMTHDAPTLRRCAEVLRATGATDHAGYVQCRAELSAGRVHEARRALDRVRPVVASTVPLPRSSIESLRRVVRPRIVVVATNPTATGRTLASCDGDVVVVAEPAVARRLPAAARRRVLPEATRLGDLGTGPVVVIADRAVPVTRGWAPMLVAIAGDGGAVPATNGAPWPQASHRVPVPSASAAVLRAHERRLAAEAAEPRPITAPGGPCLALGAALVEALADQPLDSAGLAAAAATRATVLLAPTVYVHDTGPAPLLTAALIVKDETEFLEGCLRSLEGLVDEVVVHDTGSTDGTVELARRLGAVVIEGQWRDDFAWARNVALDACRSTWVLSIDADEVVELTAGPDAVRQTLAGIESFDFCSLLLDNVEGSRLAPVRRLKPIQVPRLLRRTQVVWAGALHEQPAPIPGRGPLRSATFDPIRLLHLGYLAEVMESRDKDARNLRIAAASLDERDGKALFDLGRALMSANPEEALRRFRQCAAVANNPIFVRAGHEYAAGMLIQLGRFDEAIEEADRLLTVCDGIDGPAKLMKTKALLGLGRAAEALGVFETVVEPNDRFSVNSPEVLAELHGRCLHAVGRRADAAAVVDAGLAVSPNAPGLWALAAELLPEPIVAARFGAVPADGLRPVLGALLSAEPSAAHAAAEQLWALHPGAPAVLAFAAELAPNLPVSDALVWVDRMRAAGIHAAADPLERIAAEPGRPALDHVLALAALVHGHGRDDERSRLETWTGRVDDADLDRLARTVLELAPSAADAVAIGAATTPARTAALLPAMLDAGHDGVAAALFAHAVQQAVSAGIGEIEGLTPETVARVGERAARAGRPDVARLVAELLGKD